MRALIFTVQTTLEECPLTPGASLVARCALWLLQVLGSAILQQVYVVEYVVHHQMCSECHRREASDFWRAVVQVRQKVGVVQLKGLVYVCV